MGWVHILTTRRKRLRGFTIVELLIVIVIIAILAAVTIAAYNGVRRRAYTAQVQSNINTVQGFLEVYNSTNGIYPQTTTNTQANWHAADVRTDKNCANGSSQADWIPGITIALPQSDPNAEPGVDDVKGCYIYVSDGANYVISAWNMLSSPQSSMFYRRVGFRQFSSSSSTQFYTCNDAGVGGVSGGTYKIGDDYYKHSYTVSNIADCNETPPSGA